MKKCVISLALVLAIATGLTACNTGAAESSGASSASATKATSITTSEPDTTPDPTTATSATESESDKDTDTGSSDETTEDPASFTESEPPYSDSKADPTGPEDTSGSGPDTGATDSSSDGSTDPSTPSDDGSGDDGSAVKVHWDVYEESKPLVPVVHRLREERIDDFIPSSDYGQVMPFCASHGEKQYEDDVEYSERFGFIDAKGRLICDGVFCSYTVLEKGYIVNKTVPSTSGGTENWCSGYISKDGSFYTGTLYDDTSVDDDDLYLIRYASDTLTYKVLNMTSGKLSEERTLKINGIRESRESEEYFYYDYIKIVENRYIICVGESLTVSGVCDGMTGKMVDFPIDKEDWHRATLYENTLYDYRYDFDDDSKTSGFLYAASGELLYEPKVVDRVSENSILVVLPDSLVMLDKNGKLLSTIPTNSIAPFEEIRNSNNYLLFCTKEGLQIYDTEFKYLRTISEVKTTNYALIYDYHNLKADSYVRPYDIDGNYFPFIINIRTGEKIDIGDAFDCSIVSGTSNLMLEFGTGYDKRSFKIIGAKDGSVLYEGEMPSSSYTDYLFDEAKSLSYMFIIDYDKHTTQILDMSSMQLMFDGEIPSGFYYINGVYDGAVLCSNSKKETCLIDRDGKIAFLYYPMTFED